ncbi:hypothetical protein DVH24_004197 [Malus domestica]|uniref:non-specific serine/threonine protein kinase n=1 Tax=Malus domestica TaxID=3750 RepID=A0A498KCM0_MALDO|nr:hypothetical protein DVH24_004197 [Malus domestica]
MAADGAAAAEASPPRSPLSRIYEQREETMVSLKHGQKQKRRLARFLKPCATGFTTAVGPPKIPLLCEPCVTARYLDWWEKSKSARADAIRKEVMVATQKIKRFNASVTERKLQMQKECAQTLTKSKPEKNYSYVMPETSAIPPKQVKKELPADHTDDDDDDDIPLSERMNRKFPRKVENESASDHSDDSGSVSKRKLVTKAEGFPAKKRNAVDFCKSLTKIATKGKKAGEGTNVQVDVPSRMGDKHKVATKVSEKAASREGKKAMPEGSFKKPMGVNDHKRNQPEKGSLKEVKKTKPDDSMESVEILTRVANLEKFLGKSLKKSIKEYHDTKTLASFANISFKTDSSRRKYIAEEIAKVGKGNITAQIFTYRELCVATNNFHPDNLLGEGGFGRVYKGKFEGTEQVVVAVKQLDRNGFQGNREFLVEVLILSLLHHAHLVNLVGYCADGDQRILAYEYMANGSLEDHLLGKKALDWNTRMKIAAGAAKGLEYLHEQANPPVIYRDFKASNILLDENFNPKLSDFGLAKLGPTGDMTHVSTRVMGTYGYCAPEYALTGQLTTKSDLYSFGVVFLEIITGRRVIDNNRPTEEQNLVTWAQPLFKDRRKFTLMADPLLEGKYPIKGLYQALAVAAMCLQEEAATRPLISDVVTALAYLTLDGEAGDTDADGNVDTTDGAGVERET